MPELTDRMMNDLQEYTAFNTLLLDDLRELLQEGLDDENTRWVCAIVDQLCCNLQREFAVEQEVGYLSEVLERFPNWQPRVERLQRNRLQLIDDLKQFQMQLNKTLPDTRIAETLREQFQQWIERLRNHKRQEHILLMDAVNLDVGQGE